MANAPISLDDLAAHIQDIRTVLTGLAYALGGQDQIDADKLRLDLLEICIGSRDNPDIVADELAKLLGCAIQKGKAEADRDRRDSDRRNT